MNLQSHVCFSPTDQQEEASDIYRVAASISILQGFFLALERKTLHPENAYLAADFVHAFPVLGSKVKEDRGVIQERLQQL